MVLYNHRKEVKHMNEYIETFIRIAVILAIAYVTFKVSFIFVSELANIITTTINLPNTL